MMKFQGTETLNDILTLLEGPPRNIKTGISNHPQIDISDLIHSGDVKETNIRGYVPNKVLFLPAPAIDPSEKKCVQNCGNEDQGSAKI